MALWPSAGAFTPHVKKDMARVSFWGSVGVMWTPGPRRGPGPGQHSFLKYVTVTVIFRESQTITKNPGCWFPRTTALKTFQGKTLFNM